MLYSFQLGIKPLNEKSQKWSSKTLKRSNNSVSLLWFYTGAKIVGNYYPPQVDYKFKTYVFGSPHPNG